MQIYRYSDSLLAVSFLTTGYKNNRIKELKDINVKVTLFVQGDDESTYLFKEVDLDKVAEIVKARKRRLLTEEQKEVLRNRLLKLHEKDVL